MNNEELPSDSDSSDEDFVPDGVEKEVSEESDGNCVDSGGEDGPEKRKTPAVDRSGSSRKKPKLLEEKENEEEKLEPAATLTVEEKKKRSDAIWADFLKDCGPPAKKKTSSEDDTATNGAKENTKTHSSTTQPSPTPVKKVTQLFEFAGEKVEVETEVVDDAATAAAKPSPLGRKTAPSASGKSSGGIAGILGQLGKKGKLSTLEKSKLDWEKFKKEQNINEELQRFNKGKMGYLERQEFLERADLRQFELEKDLRTKKRSLNR